MAIKKVYDLSVDLKRTSVRVNVPVLVQGDSAEFRIRLADNGVALSTEELNGITSVTMQSGFDAQTIIETVGTLEESVAVFRLQKGELFRSGTVQAMVQLADADDRISTLRFEYQVIPELSGNYIPGEQDITVFQRYMNDAQAKIDEMAATDVAQLTVKLADKANEDEVFLKANGININDWDEPTRQTFLEAQGIDVNMILGRENVKPLNTSFFKTGKNLFDKRKVVAKLVNQTTGLLSDHSTWVSSDVMSVIPSETYTPSGIPRGMRALAYYDSNNGFISGQAYPTTVNPPAGAVLVIVSIDYRDVGTFQLEKGTTSTAYESYREYIPKTLTEKHDVDFTEIPEKSIKVKQTDFIEQGKNLFNKDAVQVGYFVNEANGVLSPNASYVVSEPVDVEGMTSIIDNIQSRLAFYDKNDAFVSGLNKYHSQPYQVPENAKTLVASVDITATDLNTAMIVEGEVLGGYERFGYRLKNSLTSTEEDGDALKIALPPTLYALVGQEMNIYFDNIINGRDSDFHFNVSCSRGRNYEKRFSYVPESDDVGQRDITIDVYKGNDIVASASSVIIISSATAGDAENKSVLVIGDSTTANGTVIEKLTGNFADDVMNITMLGTRGTAPNNHEGISGWTVDFWRNIGVDSVVPDAINNFYNPSTQQFDFSYYMSRQGYSGVDYVVINLGVNDLFRPKSDSEMNLKIAEVMDDYQFLVDSIKAYSQDVKIGIAVTIPPHYSQDAFGLSYGNSWNRERVKRNNFYWIQSLINHFKGKESENIYLVPINTNLDTYHNMGFYELPVNARNPKIVSMPKWGSGVHPDDTGYWQKADVYWYWLKSFES